MIARRLAIVINLHMFSGPTIQNARMIVEHTRRSSQKLLRTFITMMFRLTPLEAIRGYSIEEIGVGRDVSLIGLSQKDLTRLAE